jgi:hypothetical protein
MSEQHNDQCDLALDDDEPVARCLFCGKPEELDLLEVWSAREFTLMTCCEGMNEAAVNFMNDDPRAAGKWLGGELGLNAILRGVHDGAGVRRVVDDGCGGLIVDWSPRIVPVSLKQAKDFIREHHRHCPPPVGWRFGAGVMNGPDLVGVVTVGRPVARALDHRFVTEVNRLCITTTLPSGLVWNAASTLYGWAARESKAAGFEHIITYLHASEQGTTIKAAGWEFGYDVRGRSWSTPTRLRAGDCARSPDKVMYYRTLVKRPTYLLPLGAARGQRAPLNGDRSQGELPLSVAP